jgi:hypothetical protein
MVFRSYVESDFFAEAGKLLVVAAASTTDRAEIVKATQEKKTLLARAEGVAEGRVEYAELSQLLAAFGLHGTAELREALGDALGVSVS